MKLLVVEDDSFLVEVLKIALEDNGCSEQNGDRVLFVISYEHAVCALREQYDVVSSDGSFFKNGRVDEHAGLTLIDELEDCKHTGFTIFYSGNKDQISIANNKKVAGNQVHSYSKSFGLSAQEWAKLCIDLSYQNNMKK